ncbi:uncharacterized protein UBRO_08746 [Ustilago bromivora]|uniref:Uncharacterized protein n=1 Tax=Ustilago bromivora TaxID=307758 RepID=A0A1K0GDZ7_9BASI|nr:uncharacterized protein UBRO_08746 [Ustilago bromivora]
MSSSTTAHTSVTGATSSPLATLSPHDPNLFSLISSIFEPNFLILVSYLLVNLCLAFRVIRIATRQYRQLKLTLSESGEIDAVEQLVDADSGVMEAHESLFKHKKRRKNDRSATPVADALIRLAAWAAKTNAVRAKCILALLAMVSIGSTWYYMLAFLQHSYLAYLERCHFTSYQLPPPPPPFSMKQLDQMIPALHLRVLRISQWLASLSLFKEAWMEVIKDNTSWWWSGEICIITVAAWALFLRREAERIRMPHVWTVMALGQLVAISFAFNLFNLDIIYRLDTKDLLASRCNQVHKSKRRVIEPYKEVDFEDSDRSSSDSGSSSVSDPHAGHRPGYQVALRTCDLQRVDSRPPSPPRPPSSLPPTQSRSPDPDVPSVVTFSTSYIVKKTSLPPRPTMMDKVAMVLAKVVPERFGLPLFVVAGLSSVLQHPDSFGKVMVMHLFPLLISVYPRAGWWWEEAEEEEESMMYPEDTPGLSTWQVLRRMMRRSDGKVPLWEDVKMMYLALGVVSVILRFWVTIACLKEMDGDGGLLQRGWRTATLLFPTTFFRHPAQSSISSDHVCVAISAMFFVLIESGLWIWKAAVATPSAYLAADNSDEEYDNFDNTHSKASPSTISLVDDNSKLIETQARVVVALLLLSPLLGGSATMSFYLAMRSRVVEEKEEVKLIENQKGERYVEVRKTEVEFSGMRTARVRPGRMPRAVMEEIERLEEVPVSSGSAESDVRVEGDGQGGRQTRARGARAGSAAGESERGVSSSLDEQQGAGRRTTPMRQRNPPQRYGDMMPSSSPVSSSWR